MNKVDRAVFYQRSLLNLHQIDPSHRCHATYKMQLAQSSAALRDSHFQLIQCQREYLLNFALRHFPLDVPTLMLFTAIMNDLRPNEEDYKIRRSPWPHGVRFVPMRSCFTDRNLRNAKGRRYKSFSAPSERCFASAFVNRNYHCM